MSRKVDLIGQVRAITYPGADTMCLRVHLEIEGSLVVLEFMSRRSMECLDIGTRLEVSGALVPVQGVPKIFNPAIRVLAND